MLLLRRGGCGGGLLRLDLLLCLELTMLLGYMMMRLLVVALGPLARILLLVREDMLHLLLILLGSGEVRRSCGGRREARLR